MRTTHATAAVLAAALLAGCYQEYQPATTPAPQFEPQPQPVYVQGPPGGQMDEQTAYAGGSGEFSAGGEVGAGGAAIGVGVEGGTGIGVEGAIGVEGGTGVGVDGGVGVGVEGGVGVAGAIDGGPAPSVGAADPGYAVGTVTDAEINTTLEGYGYWVEDAEYGRIWRPDATVVGVDFTPYETCGTWMWTDYGWTFSCDWSWGWLPFHYGYWGWFDDYWAWVPDYTWSPAWVEWRHGGGYVGWRPIGPQVRDHRNGRGHSAGAGGGGGRGPIVRDHRGRRNGNADWRFVADRDLASGRRIRPSLVHNNAEGLRATRIVARPPTRAASTATTRVTDVMRNRITARQSLSAGPRGRAGAIRPSSPAYGSGSATSTPGSTVWSPPARTWQQNPSRTWQRPSAGASNPWAPPATRPAPGTWQQPQPSRPSRAGTPMTPASPSTRPWTRTPSAPATAAPMRPYSPPARTYTPPSGSYAPMTPSRPSAPSRSYGPPSRSYAPMTPSRPTAPSRSYAPPSRSYSAPSSSRSYSAPSSSRSYSAPSSSRSYSAPSSSRSSSSSHGASSRSSSSSSGGGRRR